MAAWWHNNPALEDLQSSDLGFDYQYYQLLTTCMSDCLWTDKPSTGRHITNTNIGSAFYPSELGKFYISLSGKVQSGAHSPEG